MVYGRILSNHVATAIRIKLDFHRWAEYGAMAALFYIFDDMARPAAMGHEGNDRFLLPVLAFQKVLHCRRHRIPPGRRPDGNDVISCRVIRQWLDCWFIALLHFPLSLIAD